MPMRGPYLFVEIGVTQLVSWGARMRHLFTVVFALLTVAVSAQQPTTPVQVVTAMHDRYAEIWYHTLTFVQRSITHKPDGTSSTEIWHEAMLSPGRLRIEFGDGSAGNGALFVNGHEHIYREGKQVKELDRLNPLLVLGFDIYCQPVEATVAALKELHFDLSTIHEEEWNGRAVLVIGAKLGDARTAQFWIDKERLYFVRLLQPDEKQAQRTEDIRFDEYKQIEGGAWLAEHVAVESDGKLVFEEKYSDVRINPGLHSDLFDPQHFVQPKP